MMHAPHLQIMMTSLLAGDATLAHERITAGRTALVVAASLDDRASFGRAREGLARLGAGGSPLADEARWLGYRLAPAAAPAAPSVPFRRGVGRCGHVWRKLQVDSASPPESPSPMQALLDAIARMPMPTDACRVFHGRGGLYPGCEQWTLDAFPPVWLVTSFQPATWAGP